MNIVEKKIKRTFNASLVMSFIFVIVGLFLFIKPDTTISLISYVIGGILLIIGLSHIYRYFSSNDKLSVFGFSLSYGVLLIIAGLFLIIDTKLFSKIINIVLGIWIITSSVTKFQYSFALKRVKNKDWLPTMIVSLIMFIWGFTLLINPFSAALAITQIIGIYLIIYSILDIVHNFMVRRNFSDISEIFKENK